MIPEPIKKGVGVDLQTGERFNVHFLKHNADAGETANDDCFITNSESLESGDRNSGQSGLYPPNEFRARFKFITQPKP